VGWRVRSETSHVIGFLAQESSSVSRHSTRREMMDSPTKQTLQDPILLRSWVCFRGGGPPNQDPRKLEAPADHSLPPPRPGHATSSCCRSDCHQTRPSRAQTFTPSRSPVSCSHLLDRLTSRIAPLHRLTATTLEACPAVRSAAQVSGRFLETNGKFWTPYTHW
jgi:hypothetical protein